MPKIEFKAGELDGGTDDGLPGWTYLQIQVLLDGEHQGQLTGYYSADVIAHIKKLLGVE